MKIHPVPRIRKKTTKNLEVIGKTFNFAFRITY